MGSEDRHADSAALAQPVTTPAPAPTAAKAPKAVDNAAQAILAERERTFTTGGDKPEAPAAPAPQTEMPRSQMNTALVRAQTTDRPSPFGVLLFPPLPIPPRMT